VLGVAWLYFRPQTALIARRVDEPAPDSPTTILMSGSFTPREHEGHGVAQVLQLANRQRVLRLRTFETLDGPDLRIYPLGSPDASSRADLDKVGFLPLGPLKGNVGPQNVGGWTCRNGVGATVTVTAWESTASGAYTRMRSLGSISSTSEKDPAGPPRTYAVMST
jgi:hypothetical protein